MREEELRSPVTDFFHREGRSVYHEVPINGRIADVVASGSDLVAVELKLTDWKKGLKQAIGYQLACTRSYLCLPFDRALKMTYKSYYFEREGVGVLGCLQAKGEVRVVIESTPSPRLLPFMASSVRHSLAGAWRR